VLLQSTLPHLCHNDNSRAGHTDTYYKAYDNSDILNLFKMNSIKTISKILISIPLILLASCTIKGYDTAALTTDFRTEGFLDPDHFQIVIKAYPDRGMRGLINKRESALENAKERLNNAVIEKLSEYYLNIYLKKMGIRDKSHILTQAEKIAKLNQVMSQYLDYGYTAFEYYNEDNSAVLVHRIIKKGLRNEIESIKISFKLQNKN
jgi:hypothetical protein